VVVVAAVLMAEWCWRKQWFFFFFLHFPYPLFLFLLLPSLFFLFILCFASISLLSINNVQPSL
jgi:hypothetical protein